MATTQKRSSYNYCVTTINVVITTVVSTTVVKVPITDNGIKLGPRKYKYIQSTPDNSMNRLTR